MRGWVLALVAFGCGHSGSAPDAATGPTLTVVRHATVGMVVSEPAGIRCGACQVPQSGGVPCPAGSTTDHACSFEFSAGTKVELSLVGQDAYVGVVCASQTDMTVDSCSFTFAASVTVGVWGEVPVR